MLELQPGQRKLPLKAIFRKLDADDSGHLDRKEIRHLMECMGRILSNEQFEEAWNGMDTDGSGECGFDEFEAWFYRTQAAPRRAGSKQQLRRTKQELRRTFKNSIKKAGILAMGGYRAMLSEELKRQVKAMGKEPTQRSPDEMELLMKLRRMNFLAVLPEDALRRTVARLRCTVLPANTVVIEEGEQGADKMYMIIAGSVAVYRTHLLHSDLMEHVGDLAQLEHFGDEALVLGSTERPFTVESREETVFCTLSRADYEASCKADFEGGVVQKVLALRSLPLFFADNVAALIAMSYATEVHTHGRGELPVVEDKRPPRMHVLMEGKIGVSMLLHLPGPEGSAGLPVQVRFATLSPGMAFGAESILVATDRERASKGLNPREAKSRFTYAVESASARTVSFASEQFVKRASKPALRWLKAFQQETVGIKEIRKHARRAGEWQREHRGNAKALADGNVAEDTPFRQAMNSQMFRTKMVAEGIQLPRLHSPARYHKGASPRRRQRHVAPRSQSTDSALVDMQRQKTPEETLVLHKQLVQLPLDQGYGHGRVGMDVERAVVMLKEAVDLDLETKLRHIDMAEAAIMEQEYVPPVEMGWMTEALQGDLLQAELDMYDTQDLQGLPIDDSEESARGEFHELKGVLQTDNEARVRHHQQMAEALRINVAQSEQMNLKFHSRHWDPLVQRGANAAKKDSSALTEQSSQSQTVGFNEQDDSSVAVRPEVDEDVSGVPRVSSRVPISESERRRAVRTPLRKCLPGGGEKWEKVGYRESYIYGCMPTQFEWRTPIYVRSPEQPRYKTPTSGSVTTSGQLSRGGSMSLSYTSVAAGADTSIDDSMEPGSVSVINVDDRICFHRASLTDAAKEAATLVATLRPAPATWPQDSASSASSEHAAGGGCGWLRYLHIVHSEWQRIGEAAKFHIFHLGRGDIALVGGIAGTGSEVVPPTGREVAAAMADVAMALREVKDTLDTRREGERGPDGRLLPALPPHLRRFNTSSVRIALVMGTAIFRTAGQIPSTSEPLHYHLQGDALMAGTALAACAPPDAIVVGDSFREAVQFEFEVEPYEPAQTSTTVAQPDLEVTLDVSTDEVEAESQAALADRLAREQAATVLIGRVADTGTFLRDEQGGNTTPPPQHAVAASPAARAVADAGGRHVTHTADTIVGSPAPASDRSGRDSASLMLSPVPTRSSPLPVAEEASPSPAASSLGGRTPNAAADRYRRMAAKTRRMRGSPSPSAQRSQSSPTKSMVASGGRNSPKAARRRMTHLGPLAGEVSPAPNLPQIVQ
jgi:hypothetical protein